MQAMVVPASNALFDVPRNPPQSDEDWLAVRNHAIVLAESGNLLLIEGRIGDSDIWRETSAALIQAGEVAIRAAKERSVDGLTDAGSLMIDACERCHEEHWIR